jgi:hypothetical protein
MPGDKKRFSLVKPTIETPFRIDFEWWKETDSNWRIFLFDFLCEDHQQFFSEMGDSVIIDSVDPETAEVQKVDGFLYTLMNHCAHVDGFIPENLPLISHIFRIFLANNNQSLSPNQLSEIVKRPARTILVTLGGHRVYKGIRPIQTQ